jgi:predicted transposase/invertase (TIGR01784 family)
MGRNADDLPSVVDHRAGKAQIAENRNWECNVLFQSLSLLSSQMLGLSTAFVRIFSDSCLSRSWASSGFYNGALLTPGPMKRDTLFYRIFQQNPTLLFDLLPNPPANPEGYTFESVEVKETSFRVDGVLCPPKGDGIVYFSEFQMQLIPDLYERMFSEIGVYTYRYRRQVTDWQAVAIYSNRLTEQPTTIVPYELFDSGRILPIYLDELGEIEHLPLGVALLVLTILEGQEAINQAQAMMDRARRVETGSMIMEMISTVMVYKFTSLSRDEVNQMLNYTMDELRETRFYQEVSEEGREEGLRQGQRNLIVAQLKAKLGRLSPRQQARIEALPADRLPALSLALLNFAAARDLNDWLNG